MMSVNNIDFTLGSYNPNQAAGLIAMAKENDRQISDSLKGILDGFEKTTRENADIQAMNYINSLGLQDMTPDKMAGHTQALENIADSMGGLNPSKEALTALDGRGNVLTQREDNNLALEAKEIANTSNRFAMEKEGDVRALNIAMDSAIANPSMAEQIKKTLPLHLQAMFDEKVYQRREEKNKEINALNSAIIGQKVDSAWNTLTGFIPMFSSDDGRVDYGKMLSDERVKAALGDTLKSPEVVGLLVKNMNKEAAEQVKAAHEMAMDKTKAEVAVRTAALGEAELAQKGEQWKKEFEQQVFQDDREMDYKEAQQSQKAANKVNDEYQKVLEGTAFKGSVSKNVDGSLSVDPKQLGASISNRLSTAATPVEIKYKSPTVDAWWANNSNFGVSNLDFGITLARQDGVRNEIKTEFTNFKDPNTNKPLSKDTQIAMLEKLKASEDRGTNFGYTSTSDAFGSSPYYKKGKIDMEGLYAAVISDRIAAANERVRKESSKIVQDSARLGIKLDVINGYLPENLAGKYPTADRDFMNSIYLGNHNPNAKAPLDKGKGGGYTNNALKHSGINTNNNKTGQNTVKR